MRISALNNAQTSPSFGRALKKSEMEEAAKVAKEARSALNLDGHGVLVISSDKFPEATEENLNGVKRFFQTVKDLFGINSVEITGDVDSKITKAAKDTGLGTIVSYDAFDPQNAEADIKKVIKGHSGIRILNAENLSQEQLEAIEKQSPSAKTKKTFFYQIGNNDNLFDWDSNTIKDKFKGRTVVGSSHYINEENGNLWGSRTFFEERMKAPQGDFIHGVRKSGEESLFQQSQNADQVTKASKLLGRELDISTDEFTPKMFTAAKRADVASSRHFYKNFDDIIEGQEIKSVLDFEPKYFEAVQKNEAENFFDSLVKVYRGWKMDVVHSEIFEKLQKFRHALYAQGVNTLEEAQGLTQGVIEASYTDEANDAFGYELRRAKALKDAQEAALKAEEAAKAAKRIDNCRSTIKVCDGNVVDDAINFARRYKMIIAPVAIGAAAVVGLKTIFSLGKEMGAKEQSAQPINEKQLNQKV